MKGDFGAIHVGSYAGQYFITLNFGKTPKQPGTNAKTHKQQNMCTINSRYIANFTQEYINQFKKLNQNDLNNNSYNMQLNKFKKVELWRWNPESFKSKSTSQKVEDTLDGSEFVPDLVVDAGK